VSRNHWLKILLQQVIISNSGALIYSPTNMCMMASQILTVVSKATLCMTVSFVAEARAAPSTSSCQQLLVQYAASPSQPGSVLFL